MGNLYNLETLTTWRPLQPKTVVLCDDRAN